MNFVKPDVMAAKTYVAEGVPSRTGRGYVGMWAYPGIQRRPVRTDPDNPHSPPAIFDDQAEAEAEAAIMCIEELNARTYDTRKNYYDHLSGPELAIMIREADVTPTWLAFIWGTAQERVMKWLDGVMDIPHPIRVLLTIFREHPETRDTAARVTAANSRRREPKKVHDETTATPS